jgi:phosphate transport system substrate-binding protein
MSKLITVISLLLVCITGLSEKLVIKGSNTVFPIAQLWIEKMKDTMPEVEITLEGAGSSTGISALFTGTTDIANSSRWLKSGELEKMAKESKYFIPIIIGYDGIAVIVNKTLGIEEISSDTLRKIYTGEISAWNQVDPNLPKKPIIVYSRNTASGTFETFSEKILAGERMAASVRIVESTQIELDSVKNNPYAIAYTGLGYVTDSVKVLKIDGILPSKTTILSSTYPISRALYMFIDATKGYPESGALRDYIIFALSKNGQALLEQAGYVAAYGY